MKKDIMKVVAISICTMLLCGTVAFASEISFTKKAVPKNKYVLVTYTDKSTTSKTAAVLITNLYKEDGSASTYQKLKVQLGADGMEAGAVTVTKGKTYDITLKSAYQAKGKYIHLFAMGNDPTLNCLASGYLNAH